MQIYIGRGRARKLSEYLFIVRIQDETNPSPDTAARPKKSINYTIRLQRRSLSS